jgi:hypothetical protein
LHFGPGIKRAKASERSGLFARPQKANRSMDVRINRSMQRRPPRRGVFLALPREVPLIFVANIKSRRALPGAGRYERLRNIAA